MGAGIATRTAAVLTAILLLSSLGAGTVPEAVEFDRKILALYDSDDGQTALRNHVRRRVEMPLNHLGLMVEYHDVAKGLPTDARMKGYRGVVVWTASWAMKDAANFWRWLGRQIRAGRRVALMNGLAPTSDRVTKQLVPSSVIEETLGLMGLEPGREFVTAPLDIEIIEKNSAMVEFERRLAHEAEFFQEVASVGKANRVHLRLRRRSTAAISDAVVMTPAGGFVIPGYAVYLQEDLKTAQWRLNPFDFFATAFGVEDSPRPDWTTMNGTRIFYSHIDGDGFISQVKKKEDRICGEALYEEVLARYPQLPVTVSVIVVEVEKKTRGGPRSIEAARKIFAMPNIEPASHTYAHPLIWDMSLTGPDGFLPFKDRFKPEDVKEGVLMPWNISGYYFDPSKEIVFSSKYIDEQLLPPGKRCRLMLWSGNCLPNLTALAITANAGLLNLNGGDSRFDGSFPSYIYVAPLYRKEGPYFQIHSSNANENVYTQDWSTDFGGFQNVIQTFENTETPRRVSPVDIYYHFYSAEQEASLFALQKAYGWAMKSEIFPIFASRFVEIANGFISTRITRDRDAWVVSGNGECRTIRFDHTARYPDLARSEGILGFQHYQGSLYVALDDGDRHRIVLSDAPPREPYLDRASAYVNEFSREGGGFAFRTSATKAPRFVWKNLAASRAYDVAITSEGATRAISIQSDPTGVLDLRLDLYGDARVTVKPSA